MVENGTTAIIPAIAALDAASVSLLAFAHWKESTPLISWPEVEFVNGEKVPAASPASLPIDGASDTKSVPPQRSSPDRPLRASPLAPGSFMIAPNQGDHGDHGESVGHKKGLEPAPSALGCRLVRVTLLPGNTRS